MSVLTDLSISYESLPGEPSFFVTSQQATPITLETPQEALSLPYLAQSSRPRAPISNFEFAPSISTRHAVKRVASHAPKTVSKPSAKPLQTDTAPSKAAEIVKQTATAVKEVQKTSRGMFNEFERASLLSYMQRRQFS